MATNRQISRRQVLRVGAVVAAAATTTLAVDGAANAVQTEPYQPTGKRADLGRVARAGGTVLLVERSGTPNAKPVKAPEMVPYAGFPPHVTPRVGDLVTVTDDWPGVAVAAIPVCHWIQGVPKALPAGGFSVAGTRLAPTPLLEKVGKTRIQVCVLDTELPTAQVLATRTA